MYYQSNNGLMDFVDTRGSQGIIKLSSKDKSEVPFRGRILNIDKDTERKSAEESKLFEFALKSFGYEVVTVLTLQAAAAEMSKSSFDYYIMDTFKYLDTAKNPMQLIFDLYSELNPNKRMNLINHSASVEVISWGVPENVNYVARWAKGLSLNHLMTDLTELTTTKVQRPKRALVKKKVNQVIKPQLSL